MPKIIVEIEWDKPDEPFWLNPDNVSLALHAYCKNTHFIVTDIQQETIDDIIETRKMNKALEL